MRVLNLQPGTDAYDDALRGFVRAERVNDIVAEAGSKRFRSYLAHCRDVFAGFEPTDPAAEYRESGERLRLVLRALEAYERKHGVTLARGRIYEHGSPRIAAAPDAVESDLIGITVHVHFGSRATKDRPERSAYDTYRDAVAAGVTPSMRRHAIAMAVTCRLPNWLHLHYVEDAELALRKLSEFELWRDDDSEDDNVWTKDEANDMHDALVQFARRAERQAREEAA